MSAVVAVFYFFVLTAAFGAVAILLSSNVFKSAIYLLVTLLSVAALYALSYAEFLAVTQILVYAGGIVVILIFGVMLTTHISGKRLVVGNGNLFSGALVGLTLFVLLTAYLGSLPDAKVSLVPETIDSIALQIFSLYSLPFEVAGILLLIALAGAAVISSQLKSKT